MGRASRKAESGAKKSPCPAYLRSSDGTRVPSTARIRIFASSTSTLALLHPAFATQPLEVHHEFLLGCSRRGDQFLHPFTGNAKKPQIGLARLGLGRDVDANGRTMPRDGNRGRRLQIAGEVLPKLANPNFGALHSCVLTVYIIISHCPVTRRQRPAQCAAPRAGLVHSLPPITVV